MDEKLTWGGDMAARLTDKQQRFVAEYLIDLNATQAAIRAGYSKKTADRIGPELLGKLVFLKRYKRRKRLEANGRSSHKTAFWRNMRGSRSLTRGKCLMKTGIR